MKLTEAVDAPSQTVWFSGEFVTLGVGKMVTVKLDGEPTHPAYVGVTLMVPVIVVPVPFAGAFHDGILPLPLLSIPMVAFVFVQLYVAFGGLLWNVLGANCPPGQELKLDKPITTATGLTNTVAVVGLPEHPETVGEMV